MADLEAGGAAAPDGGCSAEEMRARVFGAPAGTVASSRAARAATRTQQIDLAEEEHVRANEDEVLIEHIAAARAELDEFTRRREALPSREALRNDYLTALRELNLVMQSLDARHTEELENIEHAHRLPRAVKGAATGRPIRGFAAFGPKAVAEQATRAAARVLEEGAEAVAANYEELNGALAGFRQDVFVLRRNIEKVCDGMAASVELAHEERRRARELAALASEQMQKMREHAKEGPVE